MVMQNKSYSISVIRHINFSQELKRKVIFIQAKFFQIAASNIMSQLLPQFQNYQRQIPEFILKLYHILQKKQYDDYLCWNGDDEILIKSGKKLQEQVLPHFFRHKHLSSFIRQLNMYKFSKVSKSTKQRNHMYFKNDFFHRGQIKQLLKIKRNNKKNKITSQLETPSKSHDQDEVSLMHELSEPNCLLENYKREVKRSFMEIKQILDRIIEKYPEAAAELLNAKQICDEVIEDENNELGSQFGEGNPINDFQEEIQKSDIKNILTTEKNMYKFDAPLFLSNISDFSFN